MKRNERWLTLGSPWREPTWPAARCPQSSRPQARNWGSEARPTRRWAEVAGEMHAGRVKPIDTLAREEVKQIFGRETIKLLDDAETNEVSATWGLQSPPCTTGSVRPKFWDGTSRSSWSNTCRLRQPDPRRHDPDAVSRTIAGQRRPPRFRRSRSRSPDWLAASTRAHRPTS